MRRSGAAQKKKKKKKSRKEIGGARVPEKKKQKHVPCVKNGEEPAEYHDGKKKPPYKGSDFKGSGQGEKQ